MRRHELARFGFRGRRWRNLENDYDTLRSDGKDHAAAVGVLRKRYGAWWIGPAINIALWILKRWWERRKRGG